MLKNILFLPLVAVALLACGGKDVKVEADLDLICESQRFNSDDFNVKSIRYGTQLEHLEVRLATLKGEYGSDDDCIPFSLVVTNTGVDPLYLTGEQLAKLNDNSVGLYSKGTRVFKQALVPVEDNPILHGEPWKPGAQLEFAAFIKADRLKLYAPSYLTSTTNVLNASFQGPSPLLGVTAINALISIEPANLTASEVIVGFDDGVDLNQAEAIIAASGAGIKSTINFNLSPAILVLVPPNKTIDDMIQYFERDPSVKYAHRNDPVTLGAL